MTGNIEIVARINGEPVKLALSDIVCVTISTPETKLRVLPGVAAHCLRLGANVLAAEQGTRSADEIARDCAVPKATVEETLFGQGERA